MHPTIEEGTRQRVAEFLPDAIGKTLESYRGFLGQDEHIEQAKDFSAHHSACKVAIAHLELLLKLAQMVNVEESVSSEKKDYIKRVIAEAEEQVRSNNIEQNE